MDRASLNNEVILMRKSLKSVLNQTKLNLMKNIKKLKKNEKLIKSVSRKESELEALRRIKLADINLHEAADSESLKKILTRPSSSEMERASARILLNPIIQKNVQSWKQKFGAEIVDTFLKSNGENIVRGKEKANRMKNKKIQKKHTKKRTDNSDDESVDEDDDKDMSSNEEEAVDDSQGTADVKESREKKQEESTKSTNKKPSKKPANKKTIDRPEKKPKLIQMSKTSDPFFVDSSGGNYLASIANADSGADESDEERPRKTFNREKRPVQLKKSFKKPIRQRRFDETPPKPPTRFVRNDEKPKTAIQITSNDADVHPSWKAKANLRKQSMAEFTGTKIKFDD